MKNYIDQFYNEGLGFVFYVKPIKKLSKVIKNKNLLNFISNIIKVIYTILAIAFAIIMFIIKYPL